MSLVVEQHPHLFYDTEGHCLVFTGELELNGREAYKEVLSIITQTLDDLGPNLTIDFSQLSRLNSSGQGQLYRFFIHQQDKRPLQLQLKGSNKLPWQQKFLPNLKKIIPQARLYFV